MIDFIKINNYFDQHNVTLVSVTQAIDRNSASGNLHWHSLVSYAQYEREIISERVRDKIAESRRMEKYYRGMTPYGYSEMNRHIVLILICQRPELSTGYSKTILNAFVRSGRYNIEHERKENTSLVFRPEHSSWRQDLESFGNPQNYDQSKFIKVFFFFHLFRKYEIFTRFIRLASHNPLTLSWIKQNGGEGGIRTHGTVSRTQHFQCCAFDHSATSPAYRMGLI